MYSMILCVINQKYIEKNATTIRWTSRQGSFKLSTILTKVHHFLIELELFGFEIPLLLF